LSIWGGGLITTVDVTSKKEVSISYEEFEAPEAN